MNQLERFIKNNRDEFDSEEMKIGWEKIVSGIKQKNNKHLKTRYLLWTAAASIIIFVSGAIFYTNIFGTKDTPATIQQPVELPSEEFTDEVDPAYTFQMDQFARLIVLKQNELKQNQKKQPALYEQFLKDNNRLDSSYNYLKYKLSSNPNKEILLDAMIQNLQLKLDLLNRQLQIIKQTKQKKTDDEKTI